MEKGNLSINSENILPIIKKWLYSDADIFVRELVSNGADSITKLQRLDALGEVVLPENEKYFIRVKIDKEARTVKVIDNGVGMTADEIKRYINQIAFSGAEDFVKQYKDSADRGDFIGHFGLGFYSAFMVADRVEIDSLSYQFGALAAHWSCDGGIEFEMTPGTKITRGTEVTLHISEDSKQFLEDYTMRQVLKKYCGFIPVDLYFGDENEPLNDKSPLWLKKSSECTDEEYREFYSKIFPDIHGPLFWIHLNMDYPFRLKGILFFPRLKHELDSIEGQVKLFCNQIFVADNIKEVIPEFLLLLKGVVDCPDLPLNVSRSFLQNDEYVNKLSGYIVRKVADKLVALAQNERENYNKYWDDINQFIKYGCVRESGFYEKCREAVLYKTTKGEYLTLNEYLERNREKLGDKAVYTSDLHQQSQYVRIFEEQGADVIMLPSRLDMPFTTHIETFEKGTRFTRIDSELSDVMKGGEPAEITHDDLIELFKKNIDDPSVSIEVKNFKNTEIPAMIFLPEEDRRIGELGKLYGIDFGVKTGNLRLVLNGSNELVKTLAGGTIDTQAADTICCHIWDLASLSHKQLPPERMTSFIERSAKILKKFVR